MSSRREFLKTSSLALSGLWLNAGEINRHLSEYQSRRPAPAMRTFRSDAVDATIEQMKKIIIDKELAWLFENCFPNTLDTTVTHHGVLNGKLDTFIITGDIPAMWLRDSAAQVTPYLPLCKSDKKLADLIKGVINRHVKCILIDPFANAFNYDDKPISRWHTDKTAMRNELHERKWEIDSLCYAIRLSHLYWKTTGDASFMDREWDAAMKRIYDVFREQQRLTSDGSYRFKREFAAWYGDFIANDGLGLPTRKIGLIHSAFRPSDDACLFSFLVPSNFFAATSLRHLAQMVSTERRDKAFAESCVRFADEISELLGRYAKRSHLGYGNCYAYETDGFGNYYFMDDGNLPSLISLPYLGCVKPDDEIYLNTRKLILSSDHIYYFSGKAGEGYGGPHAGWEMIWHLGVIAVALTSTSDDEILKQLRILKTTHAETGFMHEAFHKDDAKRFTRSWFAWANTLFGELILKIYAERPHLLKKVI